MRVQETYEIRRGKLMFGPYAPGTTRPMHFEWGGNYPAVNLNIELQVEDHYASYDRERSKDFSVETMSNITGTLTSDSITYENLARYMGDGSTETITQAAITGHTETFTVAKQGVFLQVGVSNENDTGYRDISNVVITKQVGGSAVTLEEDVDYEVDPETGMIEIFEGGAIEAGDTIEVTVDVAESTFTRITSRTASFRGALKFVSKNKTGKDKIYYAPCAVIRPSGDMSLVTESNFAELTYTVTLEKLPGKPLLKVDGKPFTLAS